MEKVQVLFFVLTHCVYPLFSLLILLCNVYFFKVGTCINKLCQHYSYLFIYLFSLIFFQLSYHFCISYICYSLYLLKKKIDMVHIWVKIIRFGPLLPADGMQPKTLKSLFLMDFKLLILQIL